MARNFNDWLAAFVDYASIGEAPLHILYWVGVSTIAGALRRKVWIDEGFFEWVPNFYIVAVAEPGIVAKTTTANVGFNLLRQVEGINFGPSIVTWERLIQKMGQTGETFEYPPGTFNTMHAMTAAIDELGTFIDPEDEKQITALITLWDGKRGLFEKETKTQGQDQLVNPWFNMFGCTTPNWVGRNFPEAFVDDGLFSRMIWLRADAKRQRVAYVSDSYTQAHQMQGLKLVADLQEIAAHAGPFRLTPAAKAYGKVLYDAHWDRFQHGSREWMGYPARKQTHLHKLGMVISAARGNFPVIDRCHLEEAEARLTEIEPQIKQVFQTIGSREIPKAAQELVDIVGKMGGRCLRRTLYGKHFFRRLSNKEFEEVLRAAIAAGLVGVTQTNPMEIFLMEGSKP